MRYRLQRHDGTDCSATMVPITVLRMVPIQRYRHDFYTGGENSSYSKDMINGFAVCEVGIEASKEIKISESWSLPLFAKAIWNPSTEGLYFVAGLSF